MWLGWWISKDAQAMWRCVCAQLCTPWIAAHQAPLSVEFSRQEYWSGLPFPPSGNLPDPGIEPVSLIPPTLAGRLFTTVPPGSPNVKVIIPKSQWFKSFDVFLLSRHVQYRPVGGSVHV